MNLVEMKKICKNYGKVKALKNITINIKKGEFVMVIGKSGSGKSTLLHIIAGIDDACKGDIVINNTNICLLKSKELTFFRRDNIGLVYQDCNLLPSLNVKENILLPTYITGRQSDDFNEIVNVLDLTNKLETMPNELSGGGKQRVAIARALINKPKIILADEPTGNLDKETAEDIVKLLKKFNKKGQTIIMVTHNTELLKYASRVIKINDGKIVKDEYVKKNHKLKH